jgi:hypothetical protein
VFFAWLSLLPASVRAEDDGHKSDRHRPGAEGKDQLSDRREAFRNADPETRRRMLEKRHREMQEQGGHGDMPSGPGRDMGRGHDGPSRMLSQLLSNPERAARIGISPEQAEAIRTQLEANDEAMRAKQKQMMETFRRQAEVMSADTINEDEIMAVVEEAGKLHTDIAKLRIKQLLLVKNSLTKEQLGKLREVTRGKRERMDGRDRDDDHDTRDRSESDRRERPDRPERPRDHDRSDRDRPDRNF